MPSIPAICSNCGLVFPSGVAVSLNIHVANCRSGCPRCHQLADIVDGYTALIDGMVTFIVSPNYTLKEKRKLISTARAVSRGSKPLDQAERELNATNKENGRLMREWASLGLTFLSLLVSVASFLLAYLESGGNAPPTDVAFEKVEEILVTETQPDKRHGVAAEWSVRPKARPGSLKPILEQRESSRARSEPPKENRKARRARAKKSRSKR